MKMMENLANVERLIRALVVAPAAFIAAALVGPGSVVGIVLLVVAVVMLVTAIASSCPLWALFGINTRSRAAG